MKELQISLAAKNALKVAPTKKAKALSKKEVKKTAVTKKSIKKTKVNKAKENKPLKK